MIFQEEGTRAVDQELLEHHLINQIIHLRML
jgi:hypothetical protein